MPTNRHSTLVLAKCFHSPQKLPPLKPTHIQHYPVYNFDPFLDYPTEFLWVDNCCCWFMTVCSWEDTKLRALLENESPSPKFQKLASSFVGVLFTCVVIVSSSLFIQQLRCETLLDGALIGCLRVLGTGRGVGWRAGYRTVRVGSGLPLWWLCIPSSCCLVCLQLSVTCSVVGCGATACMAER